MLVLLLACVPVPDEDTTPSPHNAPPKPGPMGAPPGMTMGGSPKEDLSSSWDESLAIEVPELPASAGCPDADHDGFGDVWQCAGLDADQADCDDADPAVTPTTERWVRPGPFLMGSQSDHAGADEKPVHAVMLSGYCLDVGELAEGGKPVEEIAWAEASARCEALHKRLPTEAQWEKAARGGCEFGTNAAACDAGDLRPYPWGSDTPSCERANHQVSTSTPALCIGAADASVRNTGPYGHHELAGNVWEWASDRYHPRVYTRDPIRVDPTGPTEGDLHVLRGGGWNTFSTNMRVANRLTSNLEGTASGLRCARAKVMGNADSVAPLRTATLTGTVKSGDSGLSGRALYLTAFDADDADPQTGLMTPGRSPVAEVKLAPNGAMELPFELEVPTDDTYLVMAALDGGASTEKGGKWMAASGSGGFGRADQNPVVVGDADVSGITVTVRVEKIRPGSGGAGPPPRR